MLCVVVAWVREDPSCSSPHQEIGGDGSGDVAADALRWEPLAHVRLVGGVHRDLDQAHDHQVRTEVARLNAREEGREAHEAHGTGDAGSHDHAPVSIRNGRSVGLEGQRQHAREGRDAEAGRRHEPVEPALVHEERPESEADARDQAQRPKVHRPYSDRF